MEDRLRRLEAQVDALSRALADLTDRVGCLEELGRHPATADASGLSPAPDAASTPAAEPVDSPWSFSLSSVLTLVGRSFLVLGGAFLLRTITDAGLVPRGLGILLGLLYAAVWMGLAFRAGPRSAASSGFHALASVVIAYPLVCEAATSFHALAPTAAMLVLVALTALGFAIASRRDLPALAWLYSLGAIAAAVFLLFATREVATFTAFLLGVGAATVWLGWVSRAKGPRWLAASVVDLVMLWSVALVTDAHGLPDAYAHVSAASIRILALALPLLYLGSFALRTLARARTVGVFEIVQSAAALLIGYGGAVHITGLLGGDDAPLGAAALIAGITCYAVAFAFVRRQQGRTRNFFFYSSLAIVLVLVGALMTTSPDVCGVSMGLFALITAVLGGRFDRVTVRAHAAIYALTAASQSRIFRFVGDAFTSAAGTDWAGPSAAQGAVILLLALAYAALVVTRSFRQGPRLARLPRFTIGVLTAAGLAAVALSVGLSLLFQDRRSVPPADLAVARTAALAASAMLLAGLRRATGLREVGWPVYPLLVLGGAKLLFEDIPHGAPMTLFLAFALYGAALIVAPRLMRGSPTRSATVAA